MPQELSPERFPARQRYVAVDHHGGVVQGLNVVGRPIGLSRLDKELAAVLFPEQVPRSASAFVMTDTPSSPLDRPSRFVL